MKSRKDEGKWNLEFFIYNEGRFDHGKCVIETTSYFTSSKYWECCLKISITHFASSFVYLAYQHHNYNLFSTVVSRSY